MSRLHTEIALEHLPGIGELCDEALAMAAAADDDGELATVRARLEPATARGPQPPWRRTPGTWRTTCSRPRRAKVALARTSTRRSCATPSASTSRRRRRGARPPRVRRRPGRDGPHRARDVADLRDRCRADRRRHASSGPRSTTSPPITRRPRRSSTSAAPSSTASRRSAASGTSSGSPTSPSRSPGRPSFLRAFGGAMLMAPGPLDRGLRTFFYITPTPDDWTPEQVGVVPARGQRPDAPAAGRPRGIPGHYLQGVYANRCPSLVRTAFSSGVFAEGWAVYVTQVLVDLGYRADDPGAPARHTGSSTCAAVTNAMIDVGIHAARHDRGRRRDRLMVEGGFQEQRRGGQEVRAGPPHLDPAVRRTSSVRSRCGTSRMRCGGEAASASGDPPGRARRPAAARGRRFRRHARLRLPGTPRVGDRARAPHRYRRSGGSSSVGEADRARRQVSSVRAPGRPAPASIARRRSSSPAGSRS